MHLLISLQVGQRRVLPRSEVSLLSSSKQHRIQRRSCSRTVHKQSTDPRAIELEVPQDCSISCRPFRDAKPRYFIRRVPDLVPHDCEVIHPQLTGIDSDFPQSLSGIGVEQDPEPLLLLVETFYSLRDLRDLLERRRRFSKCGHFLNFFLDFYCITFTIHLRIFQLMQLSAYHDDSCLIVGQHDGDKTSVGTHRSNDVLHLHAGCRL